MKTLTAYIYTIIIMLGLFFSSCKSYAQSESDPEKYNIEVHDTIIDYDENSNEYNKGLILNDSISNKTYQQKSIAQKDWDKITNSKEYIYVKDKPEKIEHNYNVEPSWFIKMLQSLFDFLSSKSGKALLWILFILFILWMAYLIIKNNGIHLFARSNKKIKNKTTDELSDEFIPENWEHSILNAENQNNYRLATRHSFRHILFLLDQKSIIDLQKSKTNFQYLSSLKDKNYAVAFKQLLRHYEYVWYGEYGINDQHYSKIKTIYQSIKNQL